MAPTGRSPKRQKLSPPAEPRPQTPKEAQSSSVTSTPQHGTAETPDNHSNRSSWYPSTWSRKTAPITQVVRESISSASDTARETVAVIQDHAQAATSRKSSLALTLGKTTSYKSLPANAATTKDHATIGSPTPSRDAFIKDSTIVQSKDPSTPKPEESGKVVLEESHVSGVDKQEDMPAVVEKPNVDQNLAPRSWIGWLARGDGSSQASNEPLAVKRSTPSETPKIEEPPSGLETSVKNHDGVKTAEADHGHQEADNKRGWLPLWNSSITVPPKTTSEPPSEISKEDVEPPKSLPVPVKETVTGEASSKASSIETSLPPPQPQGSTRSSAWVFWSRDRSTGGSVSSTEHAHEGEIAISNHPSQNHPKRASIDIDSQQKPKPDQLKAETRKSTSTDDDAKQKDKGVVRSHQKQDSASSRKTTKAEGSNAVARAIEPVEAKGSRPASPAPSKKIYDHLLLPHIEETLKLPDSPSLVQQLARLFSYSKEPEIRHLNLTKEAPKIKNALAIGVHGYFPAPLIRTVLGQPTGTSIKFADMAASSIKRWTKKHGYDCQVKTAALEGEGKIAERIELLWKLLLNWVDEIRKADFVLVACHSQGVPVAIMLVAKLIHFGCLNGSRVGICAMAGVNIGPFPEYRSRWISGSAGELFEFADPTSKVSNNYLAALEEILKAGVRITYVGSIDDQLVSLDSALYSPLTHPHIYRAVSIDSRTQAPNFLSHLVAFALKLRNMGVQDHGLIRELSAPLAGSLYTGEGHSRVYEDDAVYDLAVSFALETTPQLGVPPSKKIVTSSASNPYILPFAMRGILEEDFVKSDLQSEVSNLLTQFDEWRPTTKVLKDVKFRLEGIRSRL